LCYEQSQTHTAMNKAVFDSITGSFKCMAKMGVQLDKIGDDHRAWDHDGGNLNAVKTYTNNLIGVNVPVF
jgi:hypothetical protein